MLNKINQIFKSKQLEKILLGLAVLVIILVPIFIITINYQLNEFKRMNCTNEEVTFISQKTSFEVSRFYDQKAGLFIKILNKNNQIKTYLFNDRYEYIEELSEGDKIGLFWCDYDGKRVIRGLNLTG